MAQTGTESLTFEKFLEEYPDGKGRYELVDGEIVEMRAIGAHDNVARFIAKRMDQEVDRLELDYIIERTVVVQVTTQIGQEEGRNPDVSVVNGAVWDTYLNTYVGIREPLQLAVEVTSTNWRDDYIQKLDEYQRLGIQEYWIVDYQAIASTKYLGEPKVPTVFVYWLVDGQYQRSRFVSDNLIISPTFPELKLTVNQIVAASRPRKR